MKKIFLTIKIILIVIFGISGTLSIIMFPLLIGNNDTETAIIGYYYLGLLLMSISVVYLIIKNELKQT